MKQHARRTSGFAIASVAFGLISWLGFPAPLALALGLLALNQIRSDPGLRGRGLAFAGVSLALVGVVVLGTVAASLESFRKFYSKPERNECTATLKTIHSYEKAFHERTHSYSADLSKLGFELPANARFAYVTAAKPAELKLGKTLLMGRASTVTASQVADELSSPFGGGQKPGIEDDALMVLCVGNEDSDPALEVWSISTENRPKPGRASIDVGEPFLESDDSRQPRGNEVAAR